MAMEAIKSKRAGFENVHGPKADISRKASNLSQVRFAEPITPPYTPPQAENEPEDVTSGIPFNLTTKIETVVSPKIFGLPLEDWIETLVLTWLESENLRDALLKTPTARRHRIVNFERLCTELKLDMCDIEFLLVIARSTRLSEASKVRLIHEEIAKYPVSRQIELGKLRYNGGFVC